MKTTTYEHYRNRLIKVIDHIYCHLDGALDVNTLAEVAHMSPYHFHRIYRRMSGEPINASIRRLRLQGAAAKLLRDGTSIDKIARQVGYGSLEAFSRAFRKEYRETPSDYRQNRGGNAMGTAINATSVDWLNPKDTLMAEHSLNTYPVEINHFTGQHIIGLAHHGDYMAIGQSFDKLFLFAGANKLLSEKTRSFGLYYDDPKTVETNKLHASACITGQLSELDAEFEHLKIPSGQCASILFKGPYAELENPYDYLFGQWLPNSGYEAANFPVFEEYLNDPKTTPPSELLTRIHCLLVAS